MAAFPLELWDAEAEAEAEAEEPVAWAPLVTDGPDVARVVFPVAEGVPPVTDAPVVACAPAVAVPVTTTGTKKEPKSVVMTVAVDCVVVLSICEIRQEMEVVSPRLQPYAA
jgi:hypothetical protein